MVNLYRDPDGEQWMKSSVNRITQQETGNSVADCFDDVGTLKAEIAQLKAKINKMKVSLSVACER